MNGEEAYILSKNYIDSKSGGGSSPSSPSSGSLQVDILWKGQVTGGTTATALTLAKSYKDYKFIQICIHCVFSDTTTGNVTASPLASSVLYPVDEDSFYIQSVAYTREGKDVEWKLQATDDTTVAWTKISSRNVTSSYISSILGIK